MYPAQYLREFGQALLNLEVNHGHFVCEMLFRDLVILISQTQLALRHPNNQGPSAERARRIIEEWIGILEADEPRLGELLRMGFNPNHDT